MGEKKTKAKENRRGVAALSEEERVELVRRYEKLVYKVAHRIQQNLPDEVELEDLIGWGYTGLLEAYERYDESKSTRFATYAYYRVRGAILDCCPEPILDSRRRLAESGCNEVLNTYAHVVQQHQGQASMENRLSMLSDVTGSMQMVYVLRESPEWALRPAGAPQKRKLARRQTVEKIRQLIDELPERERAVIEGFYFEERTLTDIGESLGYSPSWVSRIHGRALQRLRDRVEGSPAKTDLDQTIPV